MESTTGLIDARPALRQSKARRAMLVRSGSKLASARAESTPQNTAASELEELWDSHGKAAYTLAIALLGNELAAAEAVRLAMLDLARPLGAERTETAWPSLARDVYRHSQHLGVEMPDSAELPPIMVWVSRLARLQRASLALCVYGRMTHREAAALLDVPPSTVAELLTAGLRELGRLAAGSTAESA